MGPEAESAPERASSAGRKGKAPAMTWITSRSPLLTVPEGTSEMNSTGSARAKARSALARTSLAAAPIARPSADEAAPASRMAGTIR